ncbi:MULTISPECIES: ATP-binding protein [unclassified Rhizobacter]|uniref:ATP-binding protein n=1 Tax=unclassified Rhizobacter TaxID=2640088 RepID=UPI00138EFA57|nr:MULTISPECIES: ATP-binding protein [unclassified Rhizobacter]
MFNGNGLAKRLLIAVVLFSSLVTTFITAVDLYVDYRRDLREIDSAFRFIESSYAPSLAHSVWQFDAEAVQSQLEGLLRLPDIESARIDVEGRTRWSASSAESKRRLQASVPLTHEQGGAVVVIGTLHVAASVDGVLARVGSRLVSALVGNAVKTALVAVFLLLVFQSMVTQHLAKVARHVRDIDPLHAAADDAPLALDRPVGGRWRPDVLDTVVAAINALSNSVRRANLEVQASQAQLADSEMRLRLGMEAAAAGLWECDLVLQRVGANEECARIVGVEPSQLQPELAFWRERIHPDDLAAVAAELRSDPDPRTQALRVELRLRHEQLGWRWVVLRGRIVERDAQGAPLRALGTAMDVDDRKRAEAAVRASEARLRALTAHTAVLIYEVDANGRTIFANRGDDPPRRRVVGSLAQDWYPPAQRARFNGHLHAAFTSGSRQSFESMLPNEAGVPRHYVITIAPITAADGVRSVTITALDVSELKQAQEALVEANRRLESRVLERTRALEAARDEAERANRGKSEFLSRMSHELRTPMNAILGFAQLLEMTERSDKHAHWLSEIRHAGDHLLELIDELLDLARIEVGKLNVRLAPVDLDAVIQEAASMCRVGAAAQQVALTVDAGGDALAVVADRTRLRQILVNFLSNAIKYNRAGGRVVVHRDRSADGRCVRVTVSDTGPGIASDRLALLFTPFERLGQEDSDVQGSGIGLALSRRLAGLMHCEVGAESVEGEGSTFWIELPLAATDIEAAASAPPAVQRTAHRTLRVLYIEDNPINLALMQAAFEDRSDLALLTAQDGASGVAMAGAERPDVILLDILLPRMSGFEVLQELRRDPRLRDTPVVAVTASAMAHDVDRGKAAGFSAYVTKPFRFAELLALVVTLGTGR